MAKKKEATEQKTALEKDIQTMRRASTPILMVETSDVPGCAKRIAKALNGSAPVLHWESVNGISGLNELGKDALSTITVDECINATGMLVQSLKLPMHSNERPIALA